MINVHVVVMPNIKNVVGEMYNGKFNCDDVYILIVVYGFIYGIGNTLVRIKFVLSSSKFFIQSDVGKFCDMSWYSCISYVMYINGYLNWISGVNV
jgi:hypothetical protein